MYRTRPPSLVGAVWGGTVRSGRVNNSYQLAYRPKSPRLHSPGITLVHLPGNMLRITAAACRSWRGYVRRQLTWAGTRQPHLCTVSQLMTETKHRSKDPKITQRTIDIRQRSRYLMCNDLRVWHSNQRNDDQLSSVWKPYLIISTCQSLISILIIWKQSD